MNEKELKRVGELFIKIGKRISDEPSFLNKLEIFIAAGEHILKKEPINLAKVHELDLFQLIREKSEDGVVSALSTLNLLELKALLKKYRFGSPSRFKNSDQIKSYILNQLKQRKTDVFSTSE